MNFLLLNLKKLFFKLFIFSLFIMFIYFQINKKNFNLQFDYVKHLILFTNLKSIFIYDY